VFWAAACIWIINNFVRSTLGKALNAVRDNEMAADAMTVNTRRTKMIAFLFGAFWAGVAGGLFAHVLRYVNPGSFGLQKLAEVLAMVYFGGLNSVYGSIVGAVSISLLGEALRPLELFKWIIIPLMLILVMIFRPTGIDRLPGIRCPPTGATETNPDRGRCSMALLARVADHMTHFFGGLRAVHDYNLQIPGGGPDPGLIGPNGAGKTTIFNLFTGIHTGHRGANPPGRAGDHRQAAPPDRLPGSGPHLPEHAVSGAT
jgi:ABC-type multidrug transport system fused ATPase/permease subunit